MKSKFSIKQFLLNQFRKLFNSYYRIILDIVIKDLHNLHMLKMYNSFSVSTYQDDTIEILEHIKEIAEKVVKQKKSPLRAFF